MLIYGQETKQSDSIDRIIIDVEEEDGDFHEPMFVQHTESILDEIDTMVINNNTCHNPFLVITRMRKILSSFFVQEGIEMKEEETVMDIDSSDKNNPLAVVEYINDIYDFYKNNEVHTLLFCLFPLSRDQ